MDQLCCLHLNYSQYSLNRRDKQQLSQSAMVRPHIRRATYISHYLLKHPSVGHICNSNFDLIGNFAALCARKALEMDLFDDATSVKINAHSIHHTCWMQPRSQIR